MTRVVAFVSMRPVLIYVRGFASGIEFGMVGCLATKIGILIGELGYLLEGCAEIGLTSREIFSEGAVCCGESRNGGAITGRSCGKVGNSLNHVLILT